MRIIRTEASSIEYQGALLQFAWATRESLSSDARRGLGVLFYGSMAGYLESLLVQLIEARLDHLLDLFRHLPPAQRHNWNRVYLAADTAHLKLSASSRDPAEGAESDVGVASRALRRCVRDHRGEGGGSSLPGPQVTVCLEKRFRTRPAARVRLRPNRGQPAPLRQTSVEGPSGVAA